MTRDEQDADAGRKFFVLAMTWDQSWEELEKVERQSWLGHLRSARMTTLKEFLGTRHVGSNLPYWTEFHALAQARIARQTSLFGGET